MNNTGWRLTMVCSDGAGGYNVVRSPWLMSHAAIWEIAKRIEADAMEFPDQWPGFIGCGMEFVDGVKRR